MKKSLVLAMAMALGVTASAYAANPFSDVPAGHWAYDSISKLAAAGVIEGYGDDTFRGDRLMTRYEMAQIVAKAMAKGANVDKLAAEFADELERLHVRVSNLEKNSDNVKISMQVRYSMQNTKFGDDKATRNRLRTRIWFNGKVNDTWNYMGRIENNQEFHRTGKNVSGGEEGTSFNRAMLTGRLGGVKVTAGRQDVFLGDGNVYDGVIDGVYASYGDKINISGYYGKPTDLADNYGWTLDETFGAALGFKLGKKANLSVAYDKFKEDTDADDVDVISANLYGKLTDKFGLGVLYMHTNTDNPAHIDDGASKNGFVVTADIAGASYAKPGSWGFSAKYYYAPAGSNLQHTMNGGASDGLHTQGYKGYSLSGSYTIAKNMMYTMQWFDLKGREDGVKNKAWWNEFQMRF